MGATQVKPQVCWERPHPQTAEGAQERIKPMVRFLLERFTTYLNEGFNFFGMNDSRFNHEQFLYGLVLNDVAVLYQRFGEEQIQPELLFQLETLYMLLEMSLWKQALAKRQRWITGLTLGGVGFGGGIVFAGVLATPAVLTAVGFTTNGVAAGSWAASIQGTIYGAYTTTGLFSVAQSVGAAGAVNAGTAAGLTVGGAGAGLIVGATAAGSTSTSSSAPALKTAQLCEDSKTRPPVILMFSWEGEQSIDELWKWTNTTNKKKHELISHGVGRL